MREILQLGHPLLRQTAQPVTDFTDQSLHDLVTEMLQHLQDSNGVGLAAPQIGESLRIVIVASRPSVRYPKAPKMEPLVMINPEYKIRDTQQVKDWEGCLSIPGIRALVPRFTDIEVHFYTAQGLFTQLRMQDFIARIFQHEFDHLEGRVYLDQVESNYDIITEQEYQKRIVGHGELSC